MKETTNHWFDMCDEDLITAKAMLDAKRFLWAGFILHITAEKALKAMIAEKTNAIPPRIHDLISLAKKSGLSADLSDKQLDLLEQLNPLQMEARYPEYKNKVAATITLEICQKLYNETEELLCWIKMKLDE